MRKRAQTRSLGVIVMPGRRSPFAIPVSWSLVYAGSVTLSVCICLILNFLLVLYPSRLSEYNLLVAGGTTNLSQRLEQQIAFTRAEVRRGEENIGWMSSVSKDLESRTEGIRKTLQMEPSAFTFDDLNRTTKISSFASILDPETQAQMLGEHMKDLLGLSEKTLNITAENARQANYASWFQNHTPNRWPVPDPALFERPGKPGKRDLTPGFGNRINPISYMAEYHTGIDIDGDYGEPIYAVADGVVTKAQWHGGYGQLVEILHRSDSGGIKTRYGHNQENLVKEGDKVERGQVIALIGSTGYSTGPHIHFELMIDGEFYDAGEYIRTQIQNGIKGHDLTIKDDKDSKNPATTDKKEGEKKNVP